MDINVTLFIQIIAFLLLIYFVRKVLWDPLTAVMSERQKRISDGLSAAEKSREELDNAEAKAKLIKNEAREEAKSILSKAENRANDLVEEAKTLASEEANKIRQSADKQIESERNKVGDQLSAEISHLAVLGAAKIIGKEVDASVHEKMIDELIRKV